MSSEKLHNMPEEKAFEPGVSFLPKTSENLIDRINNNPRLHIFNKAVRNALIGAQVIGLTLTSAGCVNVINTPKAIPPTPTPIVETATGTPTENVPTESLSTPTNEATPTPEQSSLYHVMTPEEMKARDLYGQGIEVNTQVEGLDTRFFMVTSEMLTQKLAEVGLGPVRLNPETGKMTDLNAAERIGRMIRIADYEGYLQDHKQTEDQYPFEQYIQDLKDGKDRSYLIYFHDEKITVNPMAEKELVSVYDFDFKNGYVDLRTSINSATGVKSLPNGGIRLLSLLTVGLYDRLKGDNIPPNLLAGSFLTSCYSDGLAFLTLSEEWQQGKAVNGSPFALDYYWDHPIQSRMFNEFNNDLGFLIDQELAAKKEYAYSFNIIVDEYTP